MRTDFPGKPSYTAFKVKPIMQHIFQLPQSLWQIFKHQAGLFKVLIGQLALPLLPHQFQFNYFRERAKQVLQCHYTTTFMEHETPFKQLESVLFAGDFIQNIYLNVNRCISEVAAFDTVMQIKGSL